MLIIMLIIMLITIIMIIIMLIVTTRAKNRLNSVFPKCVADTFLQIVNLPEMADVAFGS